MVTPKLLSHIRFWHRITKRSQIMHTELSNFLSLYSPEYFGFSPCQFQSTGAPSQGKTKKKTIFITGLHNKPQGCGASVASAAGPFTTQKILSCISDLHNVHQFSE
jgi:hypothetical protein